MNDNKSIAAPKKEMREVHAETGMSVPTGLAKALAAEAVPPEPPKEVIDGIDPTKPPVNLFSGTVMNLEVHPNYGKYPGATKEKPIPGHELFWFPDENDAIEISRAIDSGCRLVEKDEVGLNVAPVGPGNTANDNHVRRWSKGATPQGVPIYLYLMKKPQWLYDLHQQEREEVHRKMEETIARGGGAYNSVEAKAQRDLTSRSTFQTSVLVHK